MVETDKNLSKLASLINAPMTIVRSDFPNYPKVDALNDWAWVWEAMSVTFCMLASMSVCLTGELNLGDCPIQSCFSSTKAKQDGGLAISW